ncbi:hydantoinase B/oxoprolinase family protein, partial [Rhizobiaceae sp. 2RAB30]
MATVRIAERSLQAMAGKYGEDTLADIFGEIIDSSERKSRKVIEALPDGEYEAEDVIDGDGISDRPIPIRIKVTIRGSSVTADFTGSSPSVAGPFNCSRGAL